MKICLIGNNLTNLVLANVLAKKKIIVDYYFDYCCPWTYLSFKRLIQTTTRTASVINWKPILIADIEEE